MLQRLLDPQKPVPWQMFQQDIRQVVLPIVVFRERAILMAHPIKADPDIFLPLQGGIEEGEFLYSSGRREVREEVPSLARPKSRSPRRVNWDKARYLGSAINPHARSGRPNMLHCIVFPTNYGRLRTNGELSHPQWVYDHVTAEFLLSSTIKQNPVKAKIVMDAIRSTAEAGMLS